MARQEDVGSAGPTYDSPPAGCHGCAVQQPCLVPPQARLHTAQPPATARPQPCQGGTREGAPGQGRWQRPATKAPPYFFGVFSWFSRSTNVLGPDQVIEGHLAVFLAPLAAGVGWDQGSPGRCRVC